MPLPTNPPRPRPSPPGTARRPWVGVAPGSRSLLGRTRADASRAATRVLRYAPVPATRTRKAPTTISTDRLVESLISLKEAGTTPWRREWDTSTGGHHLNLLTGHRYRGFNPVLLTLGMHLRVPILRPQVHKGSDTLDSERESGG